MLILNIQCSSYLDSIILQLNMLIQSMITNQIECHIKHTYWKSTFKQCWTYDQHHTSTSHFNKQVCQESTPQAIRQSVTKFADVTIVWIYRAIEAPTSDFCRTKVAFPSKIAWAIYVAVLPPYISIRHTFAIFSRTLKTRQTRAGAAGRGFRRGSGRGFFFGMRVFLGGLSSP